MFLLDMSTAAGGMRLFQSIPVGGTDGSSAFRKTAALAPGATFLKYMVRRFAVYALEQNVTRITKVCDWKHGACVGQMAP